MTTGADTSLPAGEGDEHFVPAVGAADTSKPEVEVAAGEKFAENLANDRAPRAVVLLVTLAVGPLKFRIVRFDELVERREPWPAWTVDRTGIDGANHNRHAVSGFWDRNQETLDLGLTA